MTFRERLIAWLGEKTRSVLASGGRRAGFSAKEAAEALKVPVDLARGELEALAEEGLLDSRIGEDSQALYNLRRDGKKAAPKETETIFSAEDEGPAFSRIIGSDGSLRQQTLLAKAAASYPPNGIHILILGPSGSGKTLMAREIWRFFCEIHGDRKEIPPFEVFNCAEYADNPQLLLGQIFGYTKGAFTGADSDHQGLVSKASGGILFLDEIHRLPASGQEMFFTMLDSSVYRPLGSNTTLHANIFLVGATTETPESFLLDTFKRRIPMLISLPPLDARPLRERLNLILLFLSQEAKRVGVPIRISTEAIKLLLMYKSSTNISNLKNEIQICAARSYLNYISGNKENGNLSIEDYNFSRQMNVSIKEDPASIDAFIASLDIRKDLLIQDDNPIKIEPGDQPTSTAFDLYRFVEERFLLYKQSSPDGEEAEKLVDQDLENKYDQLIGDMSSETLYSILHSFVSVETLSLTKELIQKAGAELHCGFQKAIIYTLSVFFQQLQQFAQADRIFSYAINRADEHKLEEEKNFVRKINPLIEEKLRLKLSRGEQNIIAIVLNQSRIQGGTARIGLIVIALGENTAAGIAQFANKALMTSLVRWIDVPIENDLESTLRQLTAEIKAADQGKGVIILADTGIHRTLAHYVNENAKTRLRALPFAGALSAVETCRQILNSDKTAGEIADFMLLSYRREINAAIDGAGKPDVVSGDFFPEGKPCIITHCITGMGSAAIIRDRLLKNATISRAAEIVSLGIAGDISAEAKRLGPRLKLTIGLLDPHIDGAPYMSIDDFLQGDGVLKVNYLLNGLNILQYQELSRFENMSLQERVNIVNRNIQEFAPSLDGDMAIRQSAHIANRIADLYPEPLPADMYLRIYIHSASMLERFSSSRKELAATEDMAKIIHDNYGFFNALDDIFRDFESLYGVHITKEEIYYYLLALPNPESYAGAQEILI
jgi:transcriptional regulator with AAA-type ATPase domain/transcriptional regulatory protein LevR